MKSIEKNMGLLVFFLYSVVHFFEVYGLKDDNGEFVTKSIEQFSKVCDMAIAAKVFTR